MHALRTEFLALAGSQIMLADRLGVDVPHVRTVDACALLLDRRGRTAYGYMSARLRQ